jgi:hypothetical protein
MRPHAEYVHVQELIADGLNDCAVSRATGSTRPTVREWRVGQKRNGNYRTGIAHLCPICNDTEVEGWWYAYLLGMYLGDGCLATHPRGVYRLRIVLDVRYPMIINECVSAIRAVKGSTAPVGQVHYSGCVEVYAFWKHWPCLFSPARPWKEAPPKDRTGVLAAGYRPRLAGSTHSRPHPVGRLPVYQSRQLHRLPALHVHELLGRHPRHLHPGMRSVGGGLESFAVEHDLRGSQSIGGQAGCCRRSEELTRAGLPGRYKRPSESLNAPRID